MDRSIYLLQPSFWFLRKIKFKGKDVEKLSDSLKVSFRPVKGFRN